MVFREMAAASGERAAVLFDELDALRNSALPA